MRRCFSVLAALTILLSPVAGRAATFSVNDVAGLRQALVDATANAEDDMIQVAAGVYDVAGAGGTLLYLPGSAGFGGDNHALTLEGADAAATVLDGGSVVRILDMKTAFLVDDGNAHVTVRQLTLRNGLASDYSASGGGAVVSTGAATATVSNCIFEGNAVTVGQSYGGGAFVATGSGASLVTGNVFRNNTANYGGGGAVVRSGGGSIAIAGNTFSVNSATSWVGGGAYVSGGGDVAIDGNVFSGNDAVQWAGGLYCDAVGAIALTGNVFENNTSYNGAGAYGGGAALTLANNIFSGNVAGGDGGGGSFIAQEGALNLTNNTFSGNTAGDQGGGVFLRVYSGAVGNVYNNILWGNTAAAGGNDGDDLYVDSDGSAVHLFNNDLGVAADVASGQSEDFVLTNAAGYLQDFNIQADPVFAADLHLAPGSLCTDRGDSGAPGLPATDFDGDPRILFAAADIGADEVKARVFRVAANAPGPAHDGASWATAFLTVQEGLAAAASGDEVWVAAAAYLEHVSIPDGVALYGGFTGTEATASQRDWLTNETIIDGRLSTGTVVSVRGSAATRLDGFTVQNGTTTPTGNAAGIVVTGEAVIANNVVRNNRAGSLGGGIYIADASRATVTNNTITGNSASWGAGIFSVFHCHETITNNRIEGNRASNMGGGIGIWASSPTIANNVIVGNYSPNGDGIAMTQSAGVTILNNTLDGRPGTGGGQGISFNQSTAVVANNLIVNFSYGMISMDTSSPTLRSNGLFGNTSNYYGPLSPSGDVVGDPLFNNRFAGDYHLQEGSPFIDAGDTTLVTAGLLDLDFEPRVYAGAGSPIVDIGADEFSYPSTRPVLSGTQGLSGWYVSAVQVDLPAIDAPGGPGIAGTDFSLDNGLAWSPFTAPFVLDAEGANRLLYRSFTSDDREEPVKEATIRIDQTPPSTTAAVTGTVGNQGWFRSNVQLTLTGIDNASGVAKIQYASSPGGPFSNYYVPVTFYNDGTATISYRSTDTAGLVGALGDVTFKIDKTAPASSIVLTGAMGQSSWYLSDVQVSLSAADAMSGVALNEYSLDGGESWTPYVAPFVIAAEGVTTVLYRAADVAGNVEVAKSAAVQIDRVPPHTSLSLEGTLGNGGWYRSDVVAALVADDGSGSGVARTEYSLDNATWLPYSGPVTLSADGVATFSFRSADVAGILETTQAASVRIDHLAPSTTALVTGTAGENGWYVSTVQVALSATDATSGVAATRYSLDNAAWATYTGPVTVSAQGSHTLLFASEDAAGNVEASQTVSFSIDTVAPSVTATDPVNGSTGVAIGQTITVTFNEPVAPGAAFSQITVLNGTRSVAAARSVAGTVLTIDPTANLPRNATITVTLPAGAVKDAAGNALNAPFSFSFRAGNR